MKLADGTQHPMLGFGTYKDAVDVGYRYFDCAQFYGNEEIVGEALSSTSVPRAELYLVSKCWNDTIYKGREAVRAQVLQSLKDLKTDYLDLYLIHWPVPEKHIEAYKELEQLQAEGKVKSIGVSNYTIEDYEELKKHMTVQPVVNQIEINPFLYRRQTIEYFEKEGVRFEAYRALRQAQELDDAIIKTIADKHKRPAAQILVRWAVQHGFAVLAKSSRKERMAENFNSFDFELDLEDMAKLDDMTTEDNLEAYRDTYVKCIVRDTPDHGTSKGVPEKFTVK
ncbi:uncharacterized protein MONBRDRAFT_8086 [Monosiga brevicollis MX1]|uniref:NADP-dependent oxidoreductase domain-containing protein n=1 Tax=Monosiga brevicollis TaxID=81824 RepID=A9UZ05_MONBE|nr:uncharacterized protein MONBRDRAFT_8086 [Monosiga brevicollis MX1]EDQ89549.1 predicted protein [Monosiga brevicollis MX1]|eukprot:XP_001745578.1 hypothetical protein [Monosiga brevicollis MX1]